MTLAEKIIRAKNDYDEVYEAGKKSQYDEFWNDYQQNGTRTNFNNAFNGYGWTEKTYKPKYPFGTINYCGSMYGNSSIVDTIYPLDITNVKANPSGLFSGATNVKIIRTITVKETNAFSNWFQSCKELQDVTFAGIIASDIDFKDCKELSKDSITNIIEHLSTTSSGKTLTVSKQAVNTAFNMTDDNPSEEWTTLVGTRQNWTISRV